MHQLEVATGVQLHVNREISISLLLALKVLLSKRDVIDQKWQQNQVSSALYSMALMYAAAVHNRVVITFQNSIRLFVFNIKKKHQIELKCNSVSGQKNSCNLYFQIKHCVQKFFLKQQKKHDAFLSLIQSPCQPQKQHDIFLNPSLSFIFTNPASESLRSLLCIDV